MRRQRDPRLEQFWRRTMARWKSSGLSIRSYCLQQSISEANFHAWRRELAKRDSDLVLNLADNAVSISEDYLAKIVDELVQNAFKFSETDTAVKVALSESPTEMVLAITDQGRGFSTEHIRKVGAYMQFDRKMQEQQGLGLGLVIAKRLTELHAGSLTIQSTRGTETTVEVRLPKAAKSLDSVNGAGRA